MRTCVVIPTYNESENIDDVISRVLENAGIDILVVDDSSPDGTADKVRIWSEKTNNRVSLLSQLKKEVLGKAYINGFKHCIENGYEIICEMDADLSHDPSALPSLVAPILESSADLVIGSRYVEGGSIPEWSLFRRLLSRGGNVYARIMLGLKVNDATGGYRAYRADLLNKILAQDIRADGYGFQIEMTYLASKAKAKIVEVPIAFNDRIHGTSKMSFAIVIEALKLVTSNCVRDRVLRRSKSKDIHGATRPADTTNVIKSVNEHDENTEIRPVEYTGER